MIRLCVPCLIAILLILTVGCRFNRSFTSLSPSQIFGSSEQGRKGIAALERGALTEAEKQLEDAVRWNKNDINHRRYYAETLWQQGKHQEALQQLDEAVKRGGKNNASLHISLADKHLTLGEYTAAYRHADEAVRLAPKDSQSWALRGRAKRLSATHAEEGDAMLSEALHSACEDYLRAVSLAPNDKGLLVELAKLQMWCGQPEQALATWLSVQSLYPKGDEPNEVLIGKTETLTMLRRFDEAEACRLQAMGRGVRR
jgi:tetratricopeptide (TPR) repeat protein